MNDKGMIITSLLYSILVLFILILFSIILTVGIRKNLIDTIADNVAAGVDYVGPTINGLEVLPVFTGQTFTAANYAAGLTATDDQSGDVTATIVCVKPASTINCTATDKAGNVSPVFTRTTTTVTAINYNYIGTVQIFTAANAGTYKLEVWGASGGADASGHGGYGGYSTGNITLTNGQILYVYVGGRGLTNVTGTGGGYNGGGNAGTSGTSGAGGGATDIRLGGAALTNRIIVAAGGGGGAGATSYTGYGGGATGGNGNTSSTNGATASAAGTSTNGDGALGIGGNHSADGGGGGGGYYGGGAGLGNNCGGGGSSYFGGVASGSTIAGNALMPTWDGATTMTGNAYSGFAKITFVSN